MSRFCKSLVFKECDRLRDASTWPSGWTLGFRDSALGAVSMAESLACGKWKYMNKHGYRSDLRDAARRLAERHVMMGACYERCSVILPAWDDNFVAAFAQYYVIRKLLERLPS